VTDSSIPAGASDAAPDFSSLTPDAVINAVEAALGVSCSSLCRPLNSYINRVYEVGLADGGSDRLSPAGFVIAKFYRPGRWSRDALQDELDFLTELHAAEVPVVPPLAGRDGALLHDLSGTWFAVFPKRGGRPLDELAPNQWIQIGRLIARLHAVGALRAPRDRIRLHPRQATQEHLRYILDSGLVAREHRRDYEDVVHRIIADIAPLFDGAEDIRIHGDCHRGNILFRPGEGYHLLDFDDMATGPAVQDLWLLLPNRLSQSRAEVELLLEGYETFLPFPRETLRLIEPLRAMRFLHYTAWCARQKADGGFARLAPGWGTAAFWRQEIDELRKQQQEILDALAATG
jgi:Ser/Thr protein kinase RdoA (MazF antagonist)